jgi:BirA family biotin operon repressor/biotin-[acetyl-CoA-carboxylase] ligase
MSRIQKIVEMLLAAGDSFISGEQLSRSLGVSRTIVWKQMKQLRAMGFELESVPHKGYRLQFAPDSIEIAEIHRKLAMLVEPSEPLLSNVQLFDEIDSTQTKAHQLAAGGAPHGTLVIAEHQTAGRGRLARPWESARGRGIWMSLILRPDLAVQWCSQLPLLISVALCHAIREQTGLPVGIKWPNDLLIAEQKVSGILLESVIEANQIRYLVVGIGINVNQTKLDFTEEIARVATSLRIESGKLYSRTDLVVSVIAHVQHWFMQYAAFGFAPIGEQWCQLCVSLNRPVRIVTNKGVIEGTAEAIDDFGALVVRTDDGQRIKQYSGDLEFMPVQ